MSELERVITGLMLMAIIVVMLLAALMISFALADECEPQRVQDDGHYWSYRIIDGKPCWYRGRPGKPKNELHWGASAHEEPPAPAEEERPVEQASRLGGSSFVAGSFADRWEGLMHFFIERHTPVKQWKVIK